MRELPLKAQPLMRSLAKLVTVNQPDKVVFVGEALVGNEAVDQLTRFDRSLRNYSGIARGIDAIILTKFDTIGACVRDVLGVRDGLHAAVLLASRRFMAIADLGPDDKVGAAVSMSYSTGAALLFVGVGQTYSDLKVLRSQAIVSALLS